MYAFILKGSPSQLPSGWWTVKYLLILKMKHLHCPNFTSWAAPSRIWWCWLSDCSIQIIWLDASVRQPVNNPSRGWGQRVRSEVAVAGDQQSWRMLTGVKLQDSSIGKETKLYDGRLIRPSGCNKHVFEDQQVSSCPWSWFGWIDAATGHLQVHWQMVMNQFDPPIFAIVGSMSSPRILARPK